MPTPKIIADFETQTATAVSASDTTFTLSSATDDDGAALPAGKYYFTVENGTPNKEYVVGTVSGTAVTAVSTVSRQGAETSGFANAHRAGSSVLISDFLTYKNYMDEIALVSAPDADTNTKGVVEGATLAEVRAGTASGGTGAALVCTPDVMDDLPTQDEKNALAAGGDFGTAGTSNKFVTEDFLGAKTPEIVNFTSSGTWTKDSGLKYIVVEVQGGGGVGGGSTGTSGGGGGGGGGGYARKTLTASDLGATETITISSGTATFGVAGGTDVVGNVGGAGAAAGTAGTAGTATGGDLNISGGVGGAGAASGTGESTGGAGGGSVLGSGGGRSAPSASSSSDSQNGQAGGGHGGGGGGSSWGNSQSATGGSGSSAIITVTEYYS
jgi:hypothetical protein